MQDAGVGKVPSIVPVLVICAGFLRGVIDKRPQQEEKRREVYEIVADKEKVIPQKLRLIFDRCIMTRYVRIERQRVLAVGSKLTDV